MKKKPTMKFCKTCRKIKSIEEFFVTIAGHIWSCLECRNAEKSAIERMKLERAEKLLSHSNSKRSDSKIAFFTNEEGLTLKNCRKCGVDKPLSEFARDTKGRLYGCLECKRKRIEKDPVLYEYQERRREENKQKRNWQIKRANERARQEVLDHYGHKCTCCGEYRREFLAIDHIRGGGGKHRKEIRKDICYWLRDNHFPSDFRLLCHSCNHAKGRCGYCPHQVETCSKILTVFFNLINY